MWLAEQHLLRAGVWTELHEDLRGPSQDGERRGGRTTVIMNSFSWLTALTLLVGLVVTGPSRSEDPPARGEGQLNTEERLNTSALNEALAFGPYRDLVTAATRPGGQQQQQQQNLLLSPLGLASALAALSRVSGAESRSQLLGALGLAADSTEQRVAAALSALSELEKNLTAQEGGAEAGVQGAGTDPGTGGAAQGPGAQMGVWSGIHTDGDLPLNYKEFLTQPHTRPPAFNSSSFETLVKELHGSDKLTLSNYVHFKGRWKHPFQRRHTVPRSFQINSTSSAEVPMMFRDDSAELKMLYDTSCSATVVRLPYAGRLASLLLLPKAELGPLGACLSNSRMNFWLSNLKPGRAEIRFPKFQMRKSYSLASLLRSSGGTSIFSNTAVFSEASAARTTKLVKALHEVRLEVDEARPEDGESCDVKLDFSVPPRITFDRPFMLIIYDEPTGLVLLLGTIIDPRDI